MMLSTEQSMECRRGCGACCSVISISSAIPGMPSGKPAGIRCIQLTDNNECAIFDKPERPAICISLRPHKEMCGSTNEEAYRILFELEIRTAPSSS
jgi:Fe-S-cluster containining protein